LVLSLVQCSRHFAVEVHPGFLVNALSAFFDSKTASVNPLLADDSVEEESTYPRSADTRRSKTMAALCAGG